MDTRAALNSALDGYEPRSDDEARDIRRVRQLAADHDPWGRDSLLHITGSAVVVHPPSGRVLLRWHERMATARREAEEETGLADLVGWPDAERPRLVHVVVVPVPAGRGEPFHEHADFRYVLATATPEAVTAETADEGAY